MPNREGHVYIAKPHGASFFKVGHSFAIESRKRHMRTLYGPTEFTCVLSEDARRDERQVLDRLARHRRKHSGSDRMSETLRCGPRGAVYQRAKKELMSVESFRVSRIVDAKLEGKDLRFRVRWAAPYTAADDTWEPLALVKDLEALDAFLRGARWARFSRANGVEV